MDALKTFPTFYIPHGGGPCFFMAWDPPDTWNKMATWLGQVGSLIGAVPKAVVVVSGYWEEKEFTVTNHFRPPLLYDYYGFPEHTYQLEYNAPGLPALARQMHKLLQEAGITAGFNSERGLDHGVFIPLNSYSQKPTSQLSNFL